MQLAPTHREISVNIYIYLYSLYIYKHLAVLSLLIRCGSRYDMFSCAVFIVYKSVLYQLVNKLFFNKRTCIGHCWLLLHQMWINASLKSYSIVNNCIRSIYYGGNTFKRLFRIQHLGVFVLYALLISCVSLWIRPDSWVTKAVLSLH